MAKAYNKITNRTDLGPLIQDEYASDIIGGAVAQSFVLSQGVRLPDMMTGTRVLPVIDQLPIAFFNNANADPSDTTLKATTDMAWKGKKIIAEELSVISVFPEAVVDDSRYDVWGQIRPKIVEAMGQKIDGAVAFGLNAPNSWPTDIAHAADAAGNVVDDSVGNDLYDRILSSGGVFAKVEADGYEVSGNYAPTTLKAKLRGLRDGSTGQPIFQRAPDAGRNMQGRVPYDLDGTPIFFDRNGAFSGSGVNLISGAFSQLVYSIRQDVTVKILTEGVIQDESGTIQHNLAQEDKIAIRVVMRLGWQVPNPPNRINEDNDSRYPFAIYVDAASSFS